MTDKKPVEVFPPGEFLREELEARGWTQSDLADILSRPLGRVNEIITGKRSITPETAQGLSEALGTSAQFWLNLQSVWLLSRTSVAKSDVARRAKLYSLAPVKDMIRRGWIEHSENVDVLEKQIMEFFQISDINDKPDYPPMAARMSASYSSATIAPRAWYWRCRNLANATNVNRFGKRSVDSAFSEIKTLLSDLEETRKIPRILADCGIRFLVVEPLASTKIDGACFWLNAKSPVVVVSLRYDRIDALWHTLIHELDHVKNRDGLKQRTPMIDSELVGQKLQRKEIRPKEEERADGFAVNFLVPQNDLDDFIARVRPRYSKKRIQLFAKRMGVHPGIVVGQLQYRGEISYAHNREMLEKVRDTLAQSALTDGWGYSSPI